MSAAEKIRTINPEAFYTPKEYAEFSGIKESTLAQQRSTGSGCRFKKLSRTCILYKGSDILDFLEGNTFESTSEYKRK